MTEYKKVFFDTAPFIYFLEENDKYYLKMKAIIQRLVDRDACIFTSSVTFEEYETGPLRKEDRTLVANFEIFISDLAVEVINIDRTIGSKAAFLRARYPGFRAMDALQLASAVDAGCDLFLTK